MAHDASWDSVEGRVALSGSRPAVVAPLTFRCAALAIWGLALLWTWTAVKRGGVWQELCAGLWVARGVVLAVPILLAVIWGSFAAERHE